MATISKNDYGNMPDMELHNGDCMNQKQFHKLYQAMPEGYRAELVDGVVYVAEPLGEPHSSHNIQLIVPCAAYEAYTPGTQASHNLTVILGDEDEVQPDLMLRILPSLARRRRLQAIARTDSPHTEI